MRYGYLIHDLFSKHGFSDGDADGCDTLQEQFSGHLTASGFTNSRVEVSLHNRRVSKIMINGVWYDTVGLAQGPPDWYLWDEGSDEEVPVPDELVQSIMGFVAKHQAS